MRSKLFVPCTRPEFFAKALASEADALSFDLEDSVPATGKEAARLRLAEFLGSDGVLASDKQLIVRVNAPGSADFVADIAMLAACRIDIINLPKVNDPGDVVAAAGVMTANVTKCGHPVGLLANIETPGALRRCAEIASAHRQLVGLQIGLNDLFSVLGADRKRRDHTHAALWCCRLGAAEASIFAYDGAWPDLDDEAGYLDEARMTASMGYLGKSCIHPRQIAMANTVYSREKSLEDARRLLATARAEEAQGRGAFIHEGRMIDRPAIVEAEALLAQAGEKP